MLSRKQRRMLERPGRVNQLKGQRRAKILSVLAKLTIFGVIFGIIAFLGIIIYFFTTVPSPDALTQRNIAMSSKIYDRNGELLYDIFDEENRTPVKIDEVPDVLKKATVAIEDKDFYKHKGFSIIGIGRSFFLLIKNRQIEGGGSTLTQQLVKNAILSTEQTFVRKIKELILAVQVERYYSKDQILEMYLNEIPYGGTAYGIEAASNLYFGKSAKDLSLGEASLLAGLPQSPSVYSPWIHPEKAKERQREVLRRMYEDGYITKDEANAAEKQELVYRTTKKEAGFKAPHFVLYVKQKLIDQYGESTVKQGGLRITTTLDYKLQQEAEKIVKEEVDKLQKHKVGNGSAVVLNPKNGNILAMVGSKDYFASSEPEGCASVTTCTFEPNYNVAIGYRQPGSATKPITFAAGLQKGYTASTMIMDVRTEFSAGAGQPPYVPVNYDGKFHGPVQVRYALANSYNIPAVKMLAMTGISNVMDLAYHMGISNWEPTSENISNVGLSLTLGGRDVRLLDLTSAFGVFANTGKRQDPVSILKITDSKGKALYEYKETEGVKVLDDGISFIISDILSDNAARTPAFGPNSVLNIKGKTVSVKTGTTDEKRDNWAVGYTPSVVVGVWVGNNNRAAMNPAISSGITGASPIWQRIMTAALKDKPDEKPQKPANVVMTDVDSLVGGAPKEGMPTRKEYFIRSTEPNATSPLYQHAIVCKDNPRKLANEGESGDEKDIIVLTENDPTGANKWQAGIDNWLKSVDDVRYAIPERGCPTAQPEPENKDVTSLFDTNAILRDILNQTKDKRRSTVQ